MGNHPCCNGGASRGLEVTKCSWAPPADGEEALAGSSSGPASSAYLAWRVAALAADVGPAKSCHGPSEVLEGVQAYLKSEASTSMAMPPLDAFLPASADLSPLARFLLARVKAANALPGPRMRVVWWGSLERLGRLPRWPGDEGHILDAEELLEAHVREMDGRGKVGGLAPCLSFFSHRWERPTATPGAAPHPDSPGHKKCAALASYGRARSCPLLLEHLFDYYFWVDYSGVDQEDGEEKALGICKLPAYTASCVETILYNSSTCRYEPRAWTRVERVLSYTYTLAPLFVYMDEGYPREPCDIAKICETQPGAFLQHPETGALCMVLRDPAGAGAQVTDSRDLALIAEIMAIATAAVPLNPAHKQALAGSARPGGGGHVRLGETVVMVDTEHYRLDFEAQQRVQMAQRAMAGGDA